MEALGPGKEYKERKKLTVTEARERRLLGACEADALRHWRPRIQSEASGAKTNQRPSLCVYNVTFIYTVFKIGYLVNVCAVIMCLLVVFRRHCVRVCVCVWGFN